MQGLNILKDGSTAGIPNVARFSFEKLASGEDIYFPSLGEGFSVIDWAVLGSTAAVGSTVVNWASHSVTTVGQGTCPLSFATVDGAYVLKVTVPDNSTVKAIIRDGMLGLEAEIGTVDSE